MRSYLVGIGKMETFIGLSRPAVATHHWHLSGRLSSELEPQDYLLAPLPFRVGRRPGLSLTIPRETVSGLHAEFFEQDQRLYVRDLNSTNGTFVNGQRVSAETELKPHDVVQFADAPFRMVAKQDDLPSHTVCQDACDQALAIVQFDRLISGNSLVPHFQPIVDIHTGEPVAWESLARSRVVGLETPGLMFAAARQLGASTELSRRMREVTLDFAGELGSGEHLFLNTHPEELAHATLLESVRGLRNLAPGQRITIEIHESTVTNVPDMLALCEGLQEIGIDLAFDDFGAGQARIAELAEVRPAYIKFDRSIIRELDQAADSRLRVVRGLVSMVRDLGIVPLAEGVETTGEHLTCRDLDFELAQGFYYGRPAPASSLRRSSTN